MNPITLTTHSPEQTVALGNTLGKLARPGDLLALIGELGAGKTQFTRGVASAMNIPPAHVASPTYVLMHEYTPETPGGTVLVHIDAYRLTSLADLESVGYSGTHNGLDELRRGAVVLIEWADRLGPEINFDSLIVRLAHNTENERHITLELPPSWTDRRDALLQALRETHP